VHDSDEFMSGFLFTLYEQKWLKFGWYLHLALRWIDFALVVVTVYLCIQFKFEAGGVQQQLGICAALAGLVAAFVVEEGFMAYLYALNYKSGVPHLELLRRTWSYAKSFAADANLRACAFLLAAVYVYAYVLAGASNMDHGALNNGTVRRLGEALDYTAETEAQHTQALFDYNVESGRDASWLGMEPLVWLLMALGFLLKFYAFVDQFFQPYTSLSIFVLSVRQGAAVIRI
jgi:hypothetical protein